jgi:hypothetical protein
VGVEADAAEPGWADEWCDDARESDMSEGKILEDKIPPTSSSPGSPTPFAALGTAELLIVVADPALAEDMAQALLKRPDLPVEVIEQLAKHATALKSRKVKLALASHPRTPRHLSVPMARQFYTFDLMKVALSPGVPADVKIAIDDVLISRLKMVTTGERLTLARRASGRVAAALLLDAENLDRRIVDAKTLERETRVMLAALENPRLTEVLVIGSVLRPAASAALVDAVARHAKWSTRREIRAALLRTEHLSLARSLEFSKEIPPALLPELLASSRLPDKIKEQLLHEMPAPKIES